MDVNPPTDQRLHRSRAEKKTSEEISPHYYLDAAFTEIPRILSLQDRNRFSKAFGCFHRSYWLHRTSDFPASIAQQGVNTLALVWKHKLENNPYYQNPKVLEWCLAGISFWMKVQKSDGSFDEWYPNERGWAGPTGYLVHAMADSYFLLGDAFPESMRKSFKQAIQKAGEYLVRYNEEFVLANHHAIALLPIYEAYLITGDEKLKTGFEKRFEEFLGYCYDEGWCLEYDGVDIGYLSGTISFLSRLHRYWPDPRIEKIVERAIEFTSYHLYPNGSFGGTTGSRQTVHFYPAGYEYWANRFPLAARMAEQGLKFLSEKKIVEPGAQEDHYVLYRVPEFIEAYLLHKRRPSSMPVLPSEKEEFEKFWPHARVFIKKWKNQYWVVNLARGGVTKGYDVENRKLLANDCGWIGRFSDGRVVTSQWNDSDNEIKYHPQSGVEVCGHGHFMVMKLFTPAKMIVFRLFMLLFGWHAATAYKIKALIRRLLMVGARKAPVRFERRVLFENDSVWIEDRIELKDGVRFSDLHYGDEFHVRYVPQSRYFQQFELEVGPRILTAAQIDDLNSKRTLSLRTRL